MAAVLVTAACSRNAPEVKFQARDITGADWGAIFTWSIQPAHRGAWPTTAAKW